MLTVPSRYFPFALSLFVTCFVFLAESPDVLAEDGLTNTVRGVATSEGTHMDRDHRDPVLSVSYGTNTSLYGNPVELRIFATNESGTYSKHPITVDIYVAGKHFESFITTSKRPVPIAAFIGDDVFDRSSGRGMDVTVVATTVHANRTFSSVAEITVFNNVLSGFFDCTYSEDDSGEEDTMFVANGVSLIQRSANELQIDQTFTAVDGSNTATVTAVLTLSGASLSGTVQVTKDGISSSVAMAGSAEVENASLSSLMISQEGGSASLKCAK